MTLRNGATVRTEVGTAREALSDGPLGIDVADRVRLQSRASLPNGGDGDLGVVDLFAGLGGLSLGFAEAAEAVGRPARCLGVDSDATAIAVYQRNMPGGRGLCADLTDVFNGRLNRRLTASERALRDMAGTVEIVLGGPPCQGHSAFNNRTRHADERNALFFTMVRAAEVLEPEHVVIENVPGALRDRSEVVQRSVDALEGLGYSLSYGVVRMEQIGVPQRRRRLLIVASRKSPIRIEEVTTAHQTPTRNVRWAIRDLAGIKPCRLVDMPARSAPQTQARIDVLFEEGLWNLPNEHRPECHANGNHSYGSIYGRLDWDEPAQTITTGFYSMCMGRYVHPSERRTITAHEAARLQFLPDSMNLEEVNKRGELARLIGNAVPTKLGYALGLELLG
ncbi:MAG TPA: DNA cytosine methyltransferase [Solirubrobacterales bacterium]|nr:DNA cytosine methyltransferase [Solirubrobacterales bacterium]